MSDAAWLLCALALGALGCSGAREKPSPPDAAPALGASLPTPTRPATTAGPADATALPQPLPPTAAEPRKTPLRLADAPYAHVFAAFRELDQKQRADHVRIVWLGDSHGAADFWSGALRTALQRRFGDGGVGFVHLGYAGYRHDGVKVVAEGKWRARPRKPAAIAPIDDGVFGLGGLLFGAESRPVRAQLTITEAPASSRLLWDVCYRLATASDEVNVGLSDGQSATLKLAPGAAPGELRHMQLTGTGDSTLSVVPSGAAELCGAVIEADPRVRPGVVLDTLGINGARLATPLAWDEARWTQELARRAPVLAVIEYGTNEAGDIAVDPRLFAHNLKALLGRVRRVNEDVDCLVLAPTDRKDTAERTPLVRNALRDAARTEGCGFWDTYEAMGGRGSIVTWHGEKPPRASRDGVHLTARGYRELGNKLAEDLLQRYRP